MKPEISILGKRRTSGPRWWRSRWWLLSMWLGGLATWIRRTGRRLGNHVSMFALLAAARHIYQHRTVRSEKWADFKARIEPPKEDQ